MSRQHCRAARPRRSGPHAQIALTFLAMLAVAPISACAGDGSSINPDASLSDMGVIPGDQSVSDLGPVDVGPVDQGTDGGPMTDDDVLPANALRFAPFLAAAPAAFGPLRDNVPAPWTTCYANEASCAAAPCALLATCCVATGDCAELQLDSDLPTALLFTNCASGASALTCLPGQPLVALAGSSPRVEAGGMRPGGDATQEGGVLVGQPIDLRVDRVELSVVFVPPVACPGNACLESASVSLARVEELSLGVVHPLVGLLYSPSRGDVSLVVGGQQRASWPLVDPSVTFTLELHPSGRVRVHRDEELLTSAVTFSPRAGAQVVLHGRNSELQGARVRSLHALQYRSEAPDVFGARTAITLTAPVDVDPWQPRDATALTHEGRTYVVVENDGALLRGELVGTTVTFDSAHRVVVDMAREAALRTPSLLVRPSGETFLVYAAELDDGTRVIRARRGVDGPLGALPDQLAVASAPQGESLDDPSVIEHAGYVLLLARHRAATGETHLELWRSPASTLSNLRDLTPAPASDLGTLTRVSPELSTQEQLRAPHLSVRGGTYRVHVERRVGTRGVIEVLVSDELRAFRSLGEVLAPRSGTLDSLGVGSPSTLHTASGVEALYFMGRDGLSERLFVTERDGVLDPVSLRDL